MQGIVQESIHEPKMQFFKNRDQYYQRTSVFKKGLSQLLVLVHSVTELIQLIYPFIKDNKPLDKLWIKQFLNPLLTLK